MTQPLLVIVAGSIAASKAPSVLRRLREAGFILRVIATARSLEFTTLLSLATAAECDIWTDATWFQPQQAAQHLQAAHFGQAVVVVGATADLMARAALGLADDLAASTLLSRAAPIVWVPAMNPSMWQHPATQAHKKTLESWGHQFVGPVSGALGTAGEGSGLGRMAEPEQIAQAMHTLLATATAASDGLLVQDLAGVRILISAGPTREYLDPVRFISNPSSGKMGFALAEQALARGAQVDLVTGPVHLATPKGAERYPVESALEMQAVIEQLHPQVNAVIMTAAVADYRAKHPAHEKQAKTAQDASIELVPNPDILLSLAPNKGHKIHIGFAMETHAGVERAAAKAARKGLDFICLNYPTQTDGGFGSDYNTVTMVEASGQAWAWERLTKHQVADRILDQLAQRLLLT